MGVSACLCGRVKKRENAITWLAERPTQNEQAAELEMRRGDGGPCAGWRVAAGAEWLQRTSLRPLACVPVCPPVSAAPLWFSRARWIWPTLPDATGRASMYSNSSATDMPSADSTVRAVCSNLCAGACRGGPAGAAPVSCCFSSGSSNSSWSTHSHPCTFTAARVQHQRLRRHTCECSISSSPQRSGGNRSWRVAAHWPHLMKAGPAQRNAAFARCGPRSGRRGRRARTRVVRGVKAGPVAGARVRHPGAQLQLHGSTPAWTHLHTRA